MAGRLAWAEAESLPFADATFDACWSVGGFNYYRDHERPCARCAGLPSPAARWSSPMRSRIFIAPAWVISSACRPSMPGGCAGWDSTANSSSMVLEFDVDLKSLAQPCLAPGSPASDLAWSGLLSGRYITHRQDSLISWRLTHVNREPRNTSPALRWEADCDIWRCPKCHGSLHHDPSGPALVCSGCAARLPIENDILIVKDQTTENNQVAQAFYDSPLWPKFRFWEWFTWVCNGGERRARNQVLTAPARQRRD